MIRISHPTILASVMLVIMIGAITYAGNYEIDWFTVGGGAGTSTGGSYTLSATIGQPAARNHPQPMTGGSYTLTSGFWVIPECPAIRADYDGDCDVDQADFRVFEGCASGPAVPHNGSEPCRKADFDQDKDVDQSDFGIFQRCYSGEDNPADPNCGA